MALRRDPVQAAAAAVQGWRAAAEAAGAVATTGVLRAEPPTPTAIPARVRLTLDLRHPDAAVLADLDAEATRLAGAAARAEGCTAQREPLWSIDPVPFDADLVARARSRCGGQALTSGPLHDAAAVARAGVPAVMVFARTLGGISHSREEDAREEDLAVAIEAFAGLVAELAQ